MQAFTLSLLENLPLIFGRRKYKLREPPSSLVLSEAIFFVQVCVEGREGKMRIGVKCIQPDHQLVALILAFVA